MTPEDIAAKYEFKRPEFWLAGYEEVGLPFYRIRLRAYTLEHKAIPPIEEFVLKTIMAGLTSTEQVAGFLGLDARIVQGAITNLIRSEDIQLSGTEADRKHRLKLTPKGTDTMEQAELVTPEQGTFEVDFDGLLRSVSSFKDQFSFAPKELRDLALVEIPAHPVRPPELADLDFQEVASQLRSVARGRKRDLLSVIAVEKRHRLFRPATALIYRSKYDDRNEVAFVVNNRPSTDHELAFARAGGPKKLGMDTVSVPSSPEEFGLEGPAAEQANEIEVLREKVATSREAIEEARDEVNRATLGEQQAQARKQLLEAQEQYEAHKKALESTPWRRLKVHDHPPLLEEALTKAKDRVLIISPWIGACVVDYHFKRKLARLCEAGVKIYIGYGIGDDGDRRKAKRDDQAEKDLVKLGQILENLTVCRLAIRTLRFLHTIASGS